jgi:hypothetical protein
MLTEDYCGVCPKCRYDRMWVRYGSEGYFQYDACPNCGFAYGTCFREPDGLTELTTAEVWDLLTEHHHKTMQEILEMTNSWPEPRERHPKSVFMHEEEIHDGKRSR